MPTLPTRLLDSDVDLGVIPLGLLTFAAATLGNAATDSDGHAEDFAAAVSAFQLGAATVADLEPLLSEHFAGAIDVTGDTLAGETAQLGKDLATGTGVLTDLDALFTTQATPAPPIGGGGVGGGGGGGSQPPPPPQPVSSCIFTGCPGLPPFNEFGP